MEEMFSSAGMLQSTDLKMLMMWFILLLVLMLSLFWGCVLVVCCNFK